MIDPMGAAEWIRLFYSSDLRQLFLDEARALAREKRCWDMREDLYQEAWLRIGELPADLDLDYYRREASSAMRRCAEKEFIIRHQTYREVRNARKRLGRAIRRVEHRRKVQEETDE